MVKYSIVKRKDDNKYLLVYINTDINYSSVIGARAYNDYVKAEKELMEIIASNAGIEVLSVFDENGNQLSMEG